MQFTLLYQTTAIRAGKLTVLLVAMGTLLGCSDNVITTPEPNVCSVETCPEGWCKLQVRFSDDCTDLFADAEILIGESLEPESAYVGTPFVSQGDIPQGTTVPVWVRAEGWQWTVEVACQDPEQDGDFKLSCNANTSP